MQQKLRILLGFALVCALVAGASQPTAAQTVTTGAIFGVVMDAQKAILPGATVVAVHVPTGTTYEAVTQSDGRFSMLAVRVGGPYTIKASMPKFRTEEQSGIQVGLGQTRQVDFTLQPAGVAETVTVVAEAQVIDTARAGTAANIAMQTIEDLPTISRSINDFARMSPYFNTNSDSAGGADMISVAGRNNRYNNMQIDGAVNNDVFGLASTGTPGGQTGTQPVSLDAIQEIQLVVSPYDVRQGGFSGGGINAVTKSGTNNFHGTAYLFGRNQKWVRSMPAVVTPANPSPLDTSVGPFSDKQVGFAVGGPIVKNRAFFFTNFDWARKTTPSGFSLDGKSGQTWGNPAYVQQALDIAKTKYNFDPGGLSEFAKPNNSNKAFVRGDFNLSPRHQLTVRTNYVDGLAYVGTQYNNTYKMPDNFYSIQDKMLSTVGQLNSTFGRVFNEFRITYQRERNVRGDQPGFSAFPEVRVDFPDGNYMYFGTEYSSQANALNQDIVEVTDDLTLLKGGHEFSFGTHNEFYKFYNLFIQYYYGGYRFSSAANFQAGLAQSFNHIFSNTSDPLEAARWPVRQFGFYAGDKWRVRNNFMLTYGLRIDLPRFPDTPHANPLAVTDFGYATSIVPSPSMWSPRVGFNWDLSRGSSHRSQLRGGAGMFTGRTPYVWLSNQYSNTGVDFTNLSVSYNANNKIPFVADPKNQPTSVTGGTTGRQTINVIDPNYKYPEILRTNIAYDHDLRFLGLIGTAEIVYTWNIKDILYENLNYVKAGSLPDGRNTYKKFDANLNDVMLLTNTTRGKSWSVSYKIERPFRNRLYTSWSYLYGRAYARNDGTSSVALSNWGNNPISIDNNNPPLARSNYDIGHRFNLTASVPIKLFKGLRSSASIFYNGQSGRPYSLGFNGDANSDGRTSNDLLFIPSSADQVVVYSSVSGQTVTWDQLNAFLNSTAAKDYRGQIMPRNSGRSHWMNQLDFRYAITIPTFKETRVEVTIDVFNFMDLLHNGWGWQYFGSFPSTNLIGYGGIDSATGKMRYNVATITSSTFQGTFTRDDLRSRGQAQIGIRYRF
jgi:hypothetical protein